ncbi:hypothetical protein FUAX_55780 (plasmid) [Fulvitalea axinellae]|uniref:Phage tail protein n=1 Tax=Fulvitalea axinellae TaxID=1182444 RepID=A0AAU9CMH4_9BACT|nr:hypothetical protein FUAX_55780 [Fulvitalea axinellae]
MGYAYKAIDRNRGVENAPGGEQAVFVASVDDFEEIKKTKTTTEPGDSCTIDGDHTFKTGKGFAKIYMSDEVMQALMESISEAGSKQYNIKAMGYLPGLNPVNSEFATAIQNDDVILLVPLRNGHVLQLGYMGTVVASGAKCASSGDSGIASGGKAGHSFEFSSYQRPLYYEGAITEVPTA